MKSKRKYVVTPGMTEYYFNFLHHCRAAENSPIMIVGPTGVGKSLFLHTYRKFFENEQRSKGIAEPRVEWANCAHFGGVHSDPNMARAEIFGLKKGIVQEAKVDKKGLVDAANGGALILEEIGELPKEVQSMLLTFIESGEYREVGGTETKYADIRIVGATNREENLRDDLRYRFFPYYLPDLHTRRGDVLYYLSYMHPDLLSTLTKNEVLKLLAYHWPGNVREIDRVARLISRDKLRSDTIAFDTPEKRSQFQLGRFHRLDNRETSLKSEATDNLLDTISAWGGDSELLESLLNRLRVGLSPDDSAPAFNDYKVEFDRHYEEQQGLATFEEKHDVKLLLPIKQFEDAFKGYLAFCGLFMQDPYINGNVFERIDGGGHMKYHNLSELKYSADEKERVRELSDAIIRNPYVNQWKDSDEEDVEAEETMDQKSEPEEIQPPDVLGLTEKELFLRYYGNLLHKTGYRIRNAAEKAGLIETTFRTRLKKMGYNLKTKTFE